MKKIFLLSCFIKCLFLNNQILPVKQGLAGTLYLRMGNSMPSPRHRDGKGTPVSRTVLVYELSQRDNNAGGGNIFSNLNTKLVAKTQSAADGTYVIALPVGSYSVFVLEGNKPYANNFDDKGNINPIKVKTDSMSKLDIVISNRAAF